MSITVETIASPPAAYPMPNTVGLHGASGVILATTVSATYLVVAVNVDGTSTNPRSVASVTSPGLTFALVTTSLSGYVNYPFAASDVEVWAAPLSGPLTDAPITISCAQGYGFDSGVVIALGLVGATGFDGGVGTLPADASDITSPANQSTVSTTNNNTMLVYAGGTADTAAVDYGPPAGWTEILWSGNALGTFQVGLTLAYYAPGTVQTGLVVNGPVSAGPGNSSMAVIGLLPSGTTVPDVVGFSDATARTAILGANLIVGAVTSTSGGTPGEVAAQSPLGGASVTIGSAVDLVEYEGAIVPNVVNTSATAVAPGIITGAGFVVGAITYASDVLTIAGNVSSQSPAAGTFAAGGSAINLVVSTGRDGLLVPLILFLTEAQAIDALTSIGLVPSPTAFAPSSTFAAGEVMSQNPSAGNPVAYGSIVSFVVSTGTPIVSDLFDTTPTVISQYANSPTLLQWIENMNQYLDQSINFAQFLAYVWNVNTAVGFGLDIWGKIVNVSRLLQIPNTTPYVGFDNGTRTPSDWEPLGSNQPGGGGIGALYSGHNATQAYLLDDDSYRQLILAKAFANICTTTAPAINTILQNLYGPGAAWVLNTGVMSISYNFLFRPSPIQLAILQQSGVIPTPPGVAVTIVSP